MDTQTHELPMLRTFIEMLDREPLQLHERREGSAFLKVAKSTYGLAEVTYVAVNISVGRKQRFIHCIYSDRYLKQYVSNQRFETDRLAVVQDMFVQRIDGLTTSLPIRTSGDELAAILIAAKTCGEVDQPCIAPMSELYALGSYFHQHMLRIWGQNCEKKIMVTQRELECLQWIAGGKTAWEVSVILGISERTVRFHLDAARDKLDCMTTTQAVAKVVAQQLIAY